MEEAIAGIEALRRDPLRERAAAYDVAREHLSPEKVLAPMLDAILS